MAEHLMVVNSTAIDEYDLFQKDYSVDEIVRALNREFVKEAQGRWAYRVGYGFRIKDNVKGWKKAQKIMRDKPELNMYI